MLCIQSVSRYREVFLDCRRLGCSVGVVRFCFVPPGLYSWFKDLVGHFDGVLYLVVVLRLLYLRVRLDCLGCAVYFVCVFLWFSSIGNSRSSSLYCKFWVAPKNFPSSFELSGSPDHDSVSKRGLRYSAHCTGSAVCPSFPAPSSCASRRVCRCAAPGKDPRWLAVFGQFNSHCVSVGLLITYLPMCWISQISDVFLHRGCVEELEDGLCRGDVGGLLNVLELAESPPSSPPCVS